jgi:hypothetical protein
MLLCKCMGEKLHSIIEEDFSKQYFGSAHTPHTLQVG